MLFGMSDVLVQRNVTRSHLEHQAAAAMVLKSPTEYRYWYVSIAMIPDVHCFDLRFHVTMINRIEAYARFLTVDEDVVRLDELCAEMMGPFHAYVLS